MNNDLISRSALIARHCDGCAEDIIQSCKTDPLCAIMMWVVEEPAVDAVEVVHGEWIEDGYFSYPCVCSICGTPVDKEFRTRYCPNCGAKMDGERKDNYDPT